MTTSAPSYPLFFDDPTPYNRVRLAGILVLATAVKMNGIKIEGEWKKQKSKDSDGATFVWQGMNPVGGESGFSITFRITNREEEAQLQTLWNALKPIPVAGSVASPTKSTTSTPTTSKVGSPSAPTAEQVLADLQKSLASLNSPTPAATQSTADAAASTPTAAASQPSPGPRPQTVGIELGWLAFLGCFACAMKSWAFDDLDVESHSDRFDVTIAFIHDRPPKPTGSGAMAPPKATAGPPTGFIGPTPAEAAAAQKAAAGAAGT